MLWNGGIDLIQDIKDRIPTNVLSNGAIRYGVYDEAGGLLRYEYIKREDEPLEEGTNINRALFKNLQGDLYTQDRYNDISISREIIEVDYPTSLKITETQKNEDCIPKSWVAEVDNNYTFYPLIENDLIEKIITTVPSTNVGSKITIGSESVDGSEDTYLETYNANCNVIFYFKKPIKITQMQIKALSSNSNRWAYVYASNDNSTWEHVYSDKIGNSTLQSVTIASPDYYKYYKIESLCSSSGFARIYEIKVEQYYEAIFAKYLYHANLELPLNSYEKGKIININGARYFDVDKSTYINSFNEIDLNINNLGAKKINNGIEYGAKYSLIYNGESWDVSYIFNGLLVPPTPSTTNEDTVASIELGANVKMVIAGLVNASEYDSKIRMLCKNNVTQKLYYSANTWRQSVKLSTTGTLSTTFDTSDKSVTPYRLGYLAIY